LTWITTEGAAILLNVTERAVRKSIKSDKYTIRRVVGKGGNSGLQYQIALESLPAAAQDLYHAQQTGQPSEIQPELDILKRTTGKQREAADRRAWIIEQYWHSRQSPDDFVTTYNTSNPECPEYPLNIHRLMRWQGKYKQGGIEALIDDRGKHRRGTSAITPEAWEYFCSLFLTQQRLSVQRCWEFVKKAHPDTPSVSTYERKVKTIPEYAIIEYRFGKKALADAMPSMLRSKLDIASNDIWYSDHHKMDVFVKNALGKVVRPWLTVFFDARSNKVVGHKLREADPNATVVKQCFKQGILSHGVPTEVYFDNGKDYRSKAFNADYPLSLVKQLGVGNIYATPYNAKAKSVERFFGTLEDRFNRLWPTYLGRDAKDRPESMRASNDKIAKIAPTMQEYEAALTAYIEEYNNTPSSGQDMGGQAPNTVYNKNLSNPRQISDATALDILCGTFAERIVGKNGAQVLSNFYWDDALIAHRNKKIIVSYLPENIDKIFVFTADMTLICEAKANTVTPYRTTTEDDYKRAQKRKRAVREHNQQYEPMQNVNVHSLIAMNQLEEKQYSERGEVNTTTQVVPVIQKNNRKFKEIAEAGCRDLGREEMTDVLLKFYDAL